LRRLDDAKALLAANRFDGATYLCGYAVEMALKARTCRVLNWPEFPSTGGEFQAYRSFQTHELGVLLHLSGQESRIRQATEKLLPNLMNLTDLKEEAISRCSRFS
jgi:hypothetical protein